MRDPGPRDALTGLPCRRAFVDRLQQAPGGGALVYLDIDGLGYVNRFLGDWVGDDTVRDLAHLAREIAPTDSIIGRWGGDEVAIRLPAASKASRVAEQLRQIAERMWRQRRALVHLEANAWPHPIGQVLSVSVGIAGSEVEPLGLWRAAQACMDAKLCGRNRVVDARTVEVGLAVRDDALGWRRPFDGLSALRDRMALP